MNQIPHIMTNDKLVLIGVTGLKSGGVLIDHIASNLDKVKTLFPGGIVVICRETSKTEKVEKEEINEMHLRCDHKTGRDY